MDQRTSGWRVWFWGVLFLLSAGILAMITVMSTSGYHLGKFDPRLLLFFVFFIGLGAGVVLLARGSNEEKEDMP